MNAADSGSPRNNELTAARLKALAFIRAEQGDSDHLPIQLFNPNRPDRTTFSSSYAALALSADSGRESLAIRRKLVTFIRSRRDWPGLWRDFGQQSLIPADLDNSALGQIVLTMHGVSCWRTDWLFYLHRHREGMFYAWMMPGNVVTLNPLYWLLALRDLTPARLHFRYFGYWKTSGKSHPRQYHIISNTHIIHYLGDTPKSSAAIDWIVDTVHTGREFERERYYRDPAGRTRLASIALGNWVTSSNGESPSDPRPKVVSASPRSRPPLHAPRSCIWDAVGMSSKPRYPG